MSAIGSFFSPQHVRDRDDARSTQSLQNLHLQSAMTELWDTRDRLADLQNVNRNEMRRADQAELKYESLKDKYDDLQTELASLKEENRALLLGASRRRRRSSSSISDSRQRRRARYHSPRRSTSRDRRSYYRSPHRSPFRDQQVQSHSDGLQNLDTPYRHIHSPVRQPSVYNSTPTAGPSTQAADTSFLLALTPRRNDRGQLKSYEVRAANLGDTS